MYTWIDKIEKHIGIPITRVTAKHSWDSWFYGTFTKGKYKGRRRGFPYVTNKCWWSRDAKVIPLTQAQGKGNTVFIGIAKDEEKRAMAKQYIDKPNTYKFPLIEWGWTEEDCVSYLKSIDLEHPLQSKFKRTGCWLCPKQSHKSLENLYVHYPALWQKLKQYEKDSPHGFNHHFTLEEMEEKIRKKINSK